MAIGSVALLLLSASPCHAFPTVQRIEEGSSPSALNGNEGCFFNGNPDLYGLGIRSGVYMTSFATALGSVYEQRTATELCKVGSLFQLAVLVALVYETIANSGQLYAVEALVIYLFCLSSLGVNFGDPTGGGKYYSPNWLEKKTWPNLVPLLRQLTVLGVDIYQAWFWFLGVYQLPRLPCRTDTFFMARVDMYGRFATFAKIWSILITMGLAIIIAFRLLKCPLQQREIPRRLNS